MTNKCNVHDVHAACKSVRVSELLKLEQTHLADIIAEEAGNECYRVHDAHFEATVDQTQKVQ